MIDLSRPPLPKSFTRAGTALVAVAAFMVIAGIRATTEPGTDRVLAHVLDRVTFGARPRDMERIAHLGIKAYIEQQLNPQRIDDSALEARLDRFETLELSTQEIAERHAIPAQQPKRDQASSQPKRQSREEIQQRRLVMSELTEQKLLRAIFSERQLQEVLVDFWFNHFNVFGGKGIERILLTSYERDVIRPHVFGSFRDLLGATAHSPAMLFYLDNWLSVDPEAAQNLADRRAEMPRGPRQQNLRRTGLNENYARELMELHTLGVDGGYTQQDIVQVARVFTGWTIDQPRRRAEFRFDARLHNNTDKVVLGQQIKARGKEEGEQVLDLLAKHPSTVRFISTKLARRFVSDNPPAALIERVARRFQESNGNLREVVRTILLSPEFTAPEAYRAKVKSPFEFVVSAVRATEAAVESAASLARTLRELGMPLYMSQPPTGYEDDANAWVNTGALVARMNFALALADNQLQGVSLDRDGLERQDNTATVRLRLTDDWLRGDASPATLDTMAKATEIAQLIALAIGSPEFQKR